MSGAAAALGSAEGGLGVMEAILVFLCRSSFYISLLGLKIPLALLLRASHARVVEVAYGQVIWHVVTALWVTIPLLVVGVVVIRNVCQRGPIVCFLAALVGMVFFHWLAIPALQPTGFGTVLLQALFAFFEDGSTFGWVWCLYHVVKLQDFVKSSDSMHRCPIEIDDANGKEGRALIVGNAPTVITGRPLGAEVDTFSDVVRFNSYSVHKPEYTGSKITYHFSNGRQLPSAKTTRAVLPIFNASLTHAVYLFMPHMEDARETCLNLMSTKANVWFVEEERILALRRKIGCHVWQIPSSGMVAIDAFLSKHQEVTLHGFNFFSGDKIHYFEESPLQLLTSWLERFVTHNPAKEKVWVTSLLKEGRAVFLDQLSPPVVREEEAEDERLAQELQESETIEAKRQEKEKNLKVEQDGDVRRRHPGLIRTLLKDGIPSQFSI